MEVFPQTQPLLCDHYRESQTQDEIGAIIRRCLARIRSWPIPRNWSFQDWFDEAEEVATVAAWLAVSGYKPPAASLFGYYVYQRILSSVRTRYRQEYLYGLRFAISLAEENSDSEEQPTERPRRYVEPAIEPVSYGDLSDAIAKLTEDNRNVIEQLFWFGRTEAQVGTSLGITQVAVHKRKQVALRLLRDRIQAK
jgi:RNA polymerase sigma factor (sigma-70 family)